MSASDDDYEYRPRICASSAVARWELAPRAARWLAATRTDPLALTGAHPNILCHEHLADPDGRCWTQQHHPSGRANSPDTVPTPGKRPRVRQWAPVTVGPGDVAQPRRQSAAAGGRGDPGWLDILRLIIERTVGWVPAVLEAWTSSSAKRSGRSGGSSGVGSREARPDAGSRSSMGPRASRRAMAGIMRLPAGSCDLGPSRWSLTFDTETTTDPGQGLRVGAYQLRRGHRLAQVGLFYEPAALPAESWRRLREYAAHTGLVCSPARSSSTACSCPRRGTGGG